MTNKCWLSQNLLGGGNNIRLEYFQYCSQQLPAKWDVFSFQDLCTHPCNMGPYIMLLQGLMVAGPFLSPGPQDLVRCSYACGP